MDVVDIAICAFIALLAALGFAQGFIVGAMSVAGLALGGILGTRLAPLLLDESHRSAYAPVLGLLGGLLLATALSATMQDMGLWLRRKVRVSHAIALDRSLGAMLSSLVAIALVWIIAAALMTLPQTRQVRPYVVRSEIVTQLNQLLPPSGPVLNTLARYDPFPAFRGPRIVVDAPPGDTPRDPQVRRAARGVVRVVGEACGFGITGSGWVAKPGVVVTNAHVVAGQGATAVQVGGRGAQIPGRVVVFDPVNDIAVLRVDGLDLPPLAVAPRTTAGVPAAVLGYPESGPFDVQPARFGEIRNFRSDDIYGRGPVTRSISSFRAVVRHGNSGGPVVGADGRVLTTVFASASGSSVPGGYGVPNSIVQAALARAGQQRTGTGPCVA